jgi:hypothetical protein
MERFKGICMMCDDITEVRHINLYVIGSEGFYCCKPCENEILEFIREKRRAIVKQKLKAWKERR